MKTASMPGADGFYPRLAHIDNAAPWHKLEEARPDDIRAALAMRRPGPEQLLALLSPAAEEFLEPMARRAHEETLRNFGRGVQVFTPLYLANFCTNRCLYCGFNTRRDIPRHMLAPEEVEAEARCIAATGLSRILALTGDAPARTGVDYLACCTAILARYFSSVGIEVPAMSVAEYARVVEAGVDSMTMFQETYNRDLYARLHPRGPKSDFAWRLDAPERAVLGGVRSVNLGPLLGLDDWRRDVFLTAMHMEYLLGKYPQLEVSVSLPRLRPCGEKTNAAEEKAFRPLPVSDTNLVQALIALRIFLPQAGVTLSTREPAFLRDRLIPLGATRVSAGVSTAVGGHSVHKQGAEEAPQFDISDPRSVEEMTLALQEMGYQPIFTDWLLTGKGLEAPLQCLDRREIGPNP